MIIPLDVPGIILPGNLNTNSMTGIVIIAPPIPHHNGNYRGKKSGNEKSGNSKIPGVLSSGTFYSMKTFLTAAPRITNPKRRSSRPLEIFAARKRTGQGSYNTRRSNWKYKTATAQDRADDSGKC